MGTTVVDAQGSAFGHVRQFAVAPTVDASHVYGMVVRLTSAKRGDRLSLVPVAEIQLDDAGHAIGQASIESRSIWTLPLTRPDPARTSPTHTAANAVSLRMSLSLWSYPDGDTATGYPAPRPNANAAHEKPSRTNANRSASSAASLLRSGGSNTE